MNSITPSLHHSNSPPRFSLALTNEEIQRLVERGVVHLPPPPPVPRPMTTEELRARRAENSRRWRAKHQPPTPAQSKHRTPAPPAPPAQTPEERAARKAETLRLWVAANRERLRVYHRQYMRQRRGSIGKYKSP